MRSLTAAKGLLYLLSLLIRHFLSYFPYWKDDFLFYTKKRCSSFKRSVSNFKSVLINSNLFIHFVFFGLANGFWGKCLFSFGQIYVLRKCPVEQNYLGQMSVGKVLCGNCHSIHTRRNSKYVVFERRSFLEYFEKLKLFSFNS